MAIGIRTFFAKAANTVINNSTVFVTVGLSTVIKKNQFLKLRWWLPFTAAVAEANANGGIKANIIATGGVGFVQNGIGTYIIADPNTPAIAGAAIATGEGGLAAPGGVGLPPGPELNWLIVEADVQNGPADGTIDLQVAQNSAVANDLTILTGGTLEVITMNKVFTPGG